MAHPCCRALARAVRTLLLEMALNRAAIAAAIIPTLGILAVLTEWLRFGLDGMMR